MRGLKYGQHSSARQQNIRRIPYGMRGLKSRPSQPTMKVRQSHPIRDAWIEMPRPANSANAPSRIPYGMRGLKLGAMAGRKKDQGRIPYGMRGLKCSLMERAKADRWSHPIRDAWIEIHQEPTTRATPRSHPIRDAWIEMWIAVALYLRSSVASHTGCVD